MNKLLKMSLALVAISSSLQANPLTYPDADQWHFTAGAETGIEGFHLRYCNKTAPARTADDMFGSTYAIGFNQSVGYGSWFYLQAKEAGSISVNAMIPGNRTAYENQRAKAIHFFDIDIRTYFPFSISQRHRITLQPLVGLAVHFNQVKQQLTPEAPPYTRFKSRSFGGMAGLALGVEPTPAFSFRAALAFEFPTLQQQTATQLPPVVTRSAWETLRMHRLGLNASFDAAYKVGRLVDLTGSLSYQTHSHIDNIGSTSSNFFDVNYSSRVGAKIGARWNF